MSKENKDIQKLVKETTKAIMSEESFITMIVKSVSEQVTIKLKEILENQNRKFSDYDKKISALEEANAKLKYQIDQLDQYNRHKCVRIFGVEESENENIDDIIMNLFNKNMKLKLNPAASIETCFRVGKRSALNEADNAVTRSATKSINKPRAILVRFVSYKERQKVMEARKMLKSSGVVIREDLTKSKVELLNQAIRKYSSRNVWSMNGKIFINQNGRRRIINVDKDI